MHQAQIHSIDHDATRAEIAKLDQEIWVRDRAFHCTRAAENKRAALRATLPETIAKQAVEAESKVSKYVNDERDNVHALIAEIKLQLNGDPRFGFGHPVVGRIEDALRSYDDLKMGAA